jgi:hypothetical protein
MSKKNEARVGFGNYAKVHGLIIRRNALVEYANLDSDTRGHVSLNLLPAELKKALDTAAIETLITAEARKQVELIDGELAALGFDTTQSPP